MPLPRDYIKSDNYLDTHRCGFHDFVTPLLPFCHPERTSCIMFRRQLTSARLQICQSWYLSLTTRRTW